MPVFRCGISQLLINFLLRIRKRIEFKLEPVISDFLVIKSLINNAIEENEIGWSYKGYIEKNANAAGVCFSGISNKLIVCVDYSLVTLLAEIS
jgi:hypothetical protein